MSCSAGADRVGERPKSRRVDTTGLNEKRDVYLGREKERKKNTKQKAKETQTILTELDKLDTVHA